jgi:hypothetical protein
MNEISRVRTDFKRSPLARGSPGYVLSLLVRTYVVQYSVHTVCTSDIKLKKANPLLYKNKIIISRNK